MQCLQSVQFQSPKFRWTTPTHEGFLPGVIFKLTALEEIDTQCIWLEWRGAASMMVGLNFVIEQTKEGFLAECHIYGFEPFDLPETKSAQSHHCLRIGQRLRGNAPSLYSWVHGCVWGTLGQLVGVRNNFHLNFICAFTRTETPVTNAIMVLCPLQMQLILWRKCIEGATLNFSL